jgi:hypothetical protein
LAYGQTSTTLVSLIEKTASAQKKFFLRQNIYLETQPIVSFLCLINVLQQLVLFWQRIGVKWFYNVFLTTEILQEQNSVTIVSNNNTL